MVEFFFFIGKKTLKTGRKKEFLKVKITVALNITYGNMISLNIEFNKSLLNFQNKIEKNEHNELFQSSFKTDIFTFPSTV
jgi:hypothetical protein